MSASVRVGSRPGVRSVTEKTASAANGLDRMIESSSPSTVDMSGRYQRDAVRSAHGSAATPACAPPAVVTHPAATQAPKYSTVEDVEADPASTSTDTVLPPGTVRSSDRDLPSPSKVVTRIGTGSSDGLATSSCTDHPSPPPCGQNQVPDVTSPGAPDDGVLETTGRVSAAATPAATRTAARTVGERRLTRSPVDGSPRAPRPTGPRARRVRGVGRWTCGAGRRRAPGAPRTAPPSRTRAPPR